IRCALLRRNKGRLPARRRPTHADGGAIVNDGDGVWATVFHVDWIKSSSNNDRVLVTRHASGHYGREEPKHYCRLSISIWTRRRSREQPRFSVFITMTT